MTLFGWITNKRGAQRKNRRASSTPAQMLQMSCRGWNAIGLKLTGTHQANAPDPMLWMSSGSGTQLATGKQANRHTHTPVILTSLRRRSSLSVGVRSIAVNTSRPPTTRPNTLRQGELMGMSSALQAFGSLSHQALLQEQCSTPMRSNKLH
jgi:hypothetical protein